MPRRRGKLPICLGLSAGGALYEESSGHVFAKRTSLVEELRTIYAEALLDSIQICVERGIRLLNASGPCTIRLHLDAVSLGHV
jgi:hypothetical protein